MIAPIHANMIYAVAEHETRQEGAVSGQDAGVGLASGTPCHHQPAAIIKAINLWERRFQQKGGAVCQLLAVEVPQPSFGTSSHLGRFAERKPLGVATPLVHEIDVGCEQGQGAICKHSGSDKLPSCWKLRQRHATVL